MLGLKCVKFYAASLASLAPCVDAGVDFDEGALEPGIDGAEAGKRGSRSRTQYAFVGAGEEQRGSEADCGDAVSEAGGQTFNQAM